MREDIDLKMIRADVIDPRTGAPPAGDDRVLGVLRQPLARGAR